jgi:hydroxymethylpyrimidine pyrophosphatase-like HAD family hydrolase
MKYKLFGIDLDGTLLSKNKKISNKNLQAINRYINAGGMPVIITGRSFVSAKLYVKEIEEYCQTKLNFLVGFNGAYIHNLKTNEIRKSVINKHITNEL